MKAKLDNTCDIFTPYYTKTVLSLNLYIIQKSLILSFICLHHAEKYFYSKIDILLQLISFQVPIPEYQ